MFISLVWHCLSHSAQFGSAIVFALKSKSQCSNVSVLWYISYISTNANVESRLVVTDFVYINTCVLGGVVIHCHRCVCVLLIIHVVGCNSTVTAS